MEMKSELSDESDCAPTVLQQRDVPRVIRALSTIADPDYLDLFTLMTGAATGGSPEQWVRAAFEEIFSSRKGFIIFRVLLRLRLERRKSPEYLGGWKIADHGDGWLRIEATSWMLTAHIVLRVEEKQVSAATIIRYHHWLASRLWPRLSVKHRQFMPLLLRKAHRALCPM
jgi:hypothetical protein